LLARRGYADQIGSSLAEGYVVISARAAPFLPQAQTWLSGTMLSSM
jgi:hypothetical protein